jgi:kynurenine formamidase
MVVTVTHLSLGTHTGTHIDAPFHFFPSGKKLHEIELDRFVGRAVVLDVRHLAKERAMIDWVALSSSTTTVSALSQVGSRAEGKADIVLLWTGWEVHWGTPKYFAHPYFSREVAGKLRDHGARIVGVDVLSPDETPVDENTETNHGWGVHEVLLGSGVLICENLRGVGDLVNGRKRRRRGVGKFNAFEHTRCRWCTCASIWMENKPRCTLRSLQALTRTGKKLGAAHVYMPLP